MTPIVEFVGWTVLEGQVTEFDDARQRYWVRPTPRATRSSTSSRRSDHRLLRRRVYAGYGRSLTGDRWYEEIVRLEFRRPF